MSTATSGWTFLKRLKTCLRNSIGEIRLNGSALMSVHRETNVYSQTGILTKFAKSSRKMMLLKSNIYRKSDRFFSSGQLHDKQQVNYCSNIIKLAIKCWFLSFLRIDGYLDINKNRFCINRLSTFWCTSKKLMWFCLLEILKIVLYFHFKMNLPLAPQKKKKKRYIRRLRYRRRICNIYIRSAI